MFKSSQQNFPFFPAEQNLNISRKQKFTNPYHIVCDTVIRSLALQLQCFTRSLPLILFVGSKKAEGIGIHCSLCSLTVRGEPNELVCVLHRLEPVK